MNITLKEGDAARWKTLTAYHLEMSKHEDDAVFPSADFHQRAYQFLISIADAALNQGADEVTAVCPLCDGKGKL